MNKIILLIIVFLGSFQLIGQNKADQIRSLKIAHLSSVLDLTPEEAEKFWPIYTNYDKKMHELRHNDIVRFIKDSDISAIENLSQSEATAKINELLNFDSDYFTTRKQFIKDAQKVISNKKILILKKAEDDFNRRLLKKYKENK